MANPEHVEIVKSGPEAISTWLLEHPEEVLNLAGANLTGSALHDADMQSADLSRAVLEGAGFNRANMTGTRLLFANLKKCTFLGTHMLFTDLLNANLTEADLSFASLNNCIMGKADFTRAKFNTTALSHISLASCVGLDSAIHEGSSSIGYDTLELSFRLSGEQFAPELKTFFLNAGVPKNLLDELPRILAKVEYCSCFICYGEPDVAFAENLVTSLKTKGVSCWLYSLDGTPGERTWPEIIRRRREAEKMIVICSCRTLVRDGALKEIEEQIDEDPSKIIPVSLDDTWKEPGFVVKRGERDLKAFLLDRNYADFGGKLPYEESLDRLLNGLKRPGR